MGDIKFVSEEIMTGIIIKSRLSLLTAEEISDWIKTIESGGDPRIKSYWKHIRGLYPRPVLRRQVKDILWNVLEENHETETI